MQAGLAGFQANLKQLNDHVSYNVFTTNSCQRDKKTPAASCSVRGHNAGLPRWLNWSEQPITWTRANHPLVVDNPRALALVGAPQIGGYTLDKVLMDGGGSMNILYYETFRRMGLTHKQLKPSNTVFHGIVPGKSARPIGKIYIETASGISANFCSKII